jgi:cytochrome c-type biogenesis protein CcmH
MLLALLLPLSVPALEIRQFDDPAKQESYERLIDELRCLVCQNQSLSESDADLAKDLRDEVYGIIQSGKSEEEAIRFLTDRYGDFVLYRPPLKPITLLLWGGPFLILLAGGLFLWRQGKRRAAQPSAIDLTDDERQRLERLRKNLEG